MAGTTPGASRNIPDILFDLTPEDDQRLQESDLLQLINYGQLQKPVKVQGTDGRVYVIEMALLWDEDYIDILRRTTAYATDPLLRVKIMRRLKLQKAIQKIDGKDYPNTDIAAQRQLWTILNRLADRQMDCLAALYDQLEAERNLMVGLAMRELSKTLESTSPDSKKHDEKERSAASAAQHAQVFAKSEEKMAQTEKIIESVVGGAVEGKTQAVRSPGQLKE